MPELTRVTDSMGDHWTYAGVSIYLSRGERPDAMYAVPGLAGVYIEGYGIPGFAFPSLDAAVDAIRTHLQPEG